MARTRICFSLPSQMIQCSQTNRQTKGQRRVLFLWMGITQYMNDYMERDMTIVCIAIVSSLNYALWYDNKNRIVSGSFIPLWLIVSKADDLSTGSTMTMTRETSGPGTSEDRATPTLFIHTDTGNSTPYDVTASIYESRQGWDSTVNIVVLYCYRT